MSQEELSALSYQAISCMNPYQLAERAVALRTEMYNELGIEPMRLENGGTLYTVTSGLVATCVMRQETVVEGDELIRRQFAPQPLVAFADVVELQPPAEQNNNEGGARLYRVEESVVAAIEARRQFHDAALDVITMPNPVHKTKPAISFDGIAHTAYQVCPDIEPLETYLSSGSDGVRVLADQRTGIRLETVRPNELDYELGVRAYVSGPAQIALDTGQFIRVTSTGLLYGPSDKSILEIDVPPDTPQSHRSEFYRIPDDASVGPTENGDIVPKGARASNDKYRHTKLNPSISPATIFELVPPDSIGWTDATAEFIRHQSRRIAGILPLDPQAHYEQTLNAARRQIREALLASPEPKVGHVGCLAVAAYLAELPATIANTKLVTAKFFGVNS